MGGTASSTNIIENAIDSSISAITDVVQDCSTQMASNQRIIIGGNNAVIDGRIDFKNMMSVDISCTQTTQVQNDLTASIANPMSQAAKSVVKGLAVGSASSTNITRNFLKLGVAVQSTFNQKCGTTLTSDQVLEVVGDDAQVSGWITFDSAQAAVGKCVQTSSVVNKIKTDIKNELKQVASAKNEGITLPSMLMLLLLLAAVAAVFVFGGTKTLTNKYVLMAIGAAVLLFVTIAFSQKWWPFSADDDDDK